MDENPKRSKRSEENQPEFVRLEKRTLMELRDSAEGGVEIRISRLIHAYDYLRRFLQSEADPKLLSRTWHELWPRVRDDFLRYTPADQSFVANLEELISRIPDYDESLLSTHMKGKKVVFVLGAGASASSGIPVAADLLNALWEKARRVGRRDLRRLETWCGSRDISDIESLLTAAYISDFVAPRRQTSALLQYFLLGKDADGPSRRGGRPVYPVYERGTPSGEPFDQAAINMVQQTLQTLFGLLISTMLKADPNPVHSAIAEMSLSLPSVSIVTTNYDGCVDEALLRKGIGLDTSIEQINPESGKPSVKLIKMHGSVNWSYCDSCYHTIGTPLLQFKERVFPRSSGASCCLGFWSPCSTWVLGSIHHEFPWGSGIESTGFHVNVVIRWETPLLRVLLQRSNGDAYMVEADPNPGKCRDCRFCENCPTALTSKKSFGPLGH